jgi:hypothetical protein
MTTTSPPATARRVRPRPPRRARWFGYLLAAAINAALLWLVHVEPGWRALTILTEDFTAVVGLLTASLMVGIALDLVYLLYDPLWVKRLGEAIGAALAAGVLWRLWVVFPIDLGERWSGWHTALRVAIGLACVGTAIAVVVNLVELVRGGTGRTGTAGPEPDRRR